MKCFGLVDRKIYKNGKISYSNSHYIVPEMKFRIFYRVKQFLIVMCTNLFLLLQHKLKSSQRDKVKKFIAFTQTGENTAIFCLSQNDWKLDLASDNYFQNPDLYYKEPKISVDKKKLEQLFARYRGSVIKIYVFLITL